LYDYPLNASSQRKAKYNWCDPDSRGIVGRFGLPRWSSLPTGRQASSVFRPKKRKNKDTGAIADTDIKLSINTAKELFLIRKKKVYKKIFPRLF
jgi:hypothetical protein